MDAPEFITTNRRGRKLVLNGYIFVLNRKNERFVYWRCSEYKTCPATLTTSTADDTITHVGNDHQHQPDLAKIEVARKTAALKNAVKTQLHVPVKRLYSEVFTAADNADADFVAAKPTFRKVKSALYNHRRKMLPPLPRRLQEVTLEGTWAETSQGKPFMLANDGDEQKIVVFSTDENLEKLSASERIFMDGTFKVAPPFFTQMYTVHVQYLGQMIPVLFALLPCKTQEIYVRLFDIVTKLCHDRRLPFQPRSIMTDFEIGVLGAIRISFPATVVRGCFFHFSQAVWRKVQALGLSVAYRESAEVKTFVRRLAVLPLVPLQELDDVWLDLHGMAPDEVPGITELCDYMVSTWVDDVHALFRRELWNHFQTLQEEGLRTNNHLESFHSAFNRSFHTVHPNIFIFVDGLKKRQDETETTVASLDIGNQPPPAKRQRVVKEDRVRRILQQFQTKQRPILSYMDAMGQTVKLG